MSQSPFVPRKSNPVQCNKAFSVVRIDRLTGICTWSLQSAMSFLLSDFFHFPDDDDDDIVDDVYFFSRLSVRVPQASKLSLNDQLDGFFVRLCVSVARLLFLPISPSSKVDD